MDKVIHLPLYGSVDFAAQPLLWNLFQTRAAARLRDISLSSVPSAFAPHGQAANRFQHSVGVAHLAGRVVDLHPELESHRLEILAAAFCHDLGSPPFSHISEVFLYHLSGRTHEQVTASLLEQSELSGILTSSGVDSRKVFDLITGGAQHPAGPLIAGSLDVDNLDNSLHLWRSLGQESRPYDPWRLAGALRYQAGELHVDSEQLPGLMGWADTRVLLYRLLHSEPVLSAGSMLYRALEFAWQGGYLHHEFFELDEPEALRYLMDLGGASAELIDHLRRWRHYSSVYDYLEAEGEPSRLWGLAGDPQYRWEASLRLASILDLQPQQLALYVGKQRSAKAIKLPFCGPRSELAAQLLGEDRARYRLAVFCAAGAQTDPERLEYAVQELLAAAPQPRQEPHAFF